MRINTKKIKEKIFVVVILLGGGVFFIWAGREAILLKIGLFGTIFAGIILLVGILWEIKGLKLLSFD